MPTAEETAAADKAAADKAAADKAAADKATADAAAKAKGAEGTTDADKAAADAAAKKAADDKAAADKAAADKKAAEEAAKGKAPEKYELKAPEGSAVDLARLEALARENNLSNDDAQAMVEAAHAITVKQSEDWLAELKGDKTYGGEKLTETQRLANLVVDKVRPKGSPRGDAFRKLLSSGVGNNLEVASFLADLGKMLKEDGAIEGEATGGGEKKPIEQRMYPNAKS